MGKKFLATVVGVLSGFLVVIILLNLANETSLVVYTTNKVQLFLMIFFILIVTAIIAEAVVGSSSLELVIDLVVVLGISYYISQSFEFAGAKSFMDYLKDFWIPIVITAVFSAFVSSWASEKLKE